MKHSEACYTLERSERDETSVINVTRLLIIYWRKDNSTFAMIHAKS